MQSNPLKRKPFHFISDHLFLPKEGKEEMRFYIAFNSLDHITTRRKPWTGRNSLLFTHSSKGSFSYKRTMHRQPSTMPHIYIANRPTRLCGFSWESNLRSHTWEPGIVTTRPRQIPLLLPYQDWLMTGYLVMGENTTEGKTTNDFLQALGSIRKPDLRQWLETASYQCAMVRDSELSVCKAWHHFAFKVAPLKG